MGHMKFLIIVIVLLGIMIGQSQVEAYKFLACMKACTMKCVLKDIKKAWKKTWKCPFDCVIDCVVGNNPQSSNPQSNIVQLKGYCEAGCFTANCLNIPVTKENIGIWLAQYSLFSHI